MRRPLHLFLLITAALLLAQTGLARAADPDEEEIPLDKVPKPVLAAIKKKFPDSKVQSAARQIDDDEIVFEILIRHKAHEIYVLCNPEGKILETDREITVKELPKAVVASLKKKYPKANIMSVEEVTEDDEVTYALLLKHNKKTLHVLFDPKGKMIEEEPYDENE